MEQLKRKRTPLRTQCTKAMKKVEDYMKAKPLDLEAVVGQFKTAERFAAEVEELSRQLYDLMLEDDASEKDLDEEQDKCMEYQASFDILRERVDKLMRNSERDRDDASEAASSVGNRTKGYHLPKLKIREFNGEFKDWLGFWSQFQQIHQDEGIDDSTKFQYLDQAIVKGSRAKEVIDKYPRTAVNYPKAIEALKNRFGRDDLQVEVYVRELLKLVISNVNQSKERLSVSRLFDQLESHLHALESLGVSSDKYDAMLYPLVESCLPIPILRAYERSELSKKDGTREQPPVTKLQYLMRFLNQEVESEQRISLASEGFGTKDATKDVSDSSHKQKKFAGKVKRDEEKTPTAAGLVNEVKSSECAFCEGSHRNDQCNKVRDLSLAERKEKLRDARSCFKCLRKGCFAPKCNSSVSCLLCGKGHHVTMCPTTRSEKQNREPKPKDEDKTNDAEDEQTTSIANIASCGEVYLQTAMVEVVNGTKRKTVRALFDTGSQRSHIKTSTAKELGFEKTGTESLTHVLFGCGKKKVDHDKFQIAVTTKDSSFQMKMNVLDQDQICNKLPSVPRGPWMSELRKRGIWLDDMDKGQEEIQMLIGSYDYGRMLTGKTVQLSCGLTAVETKVGWTVMGSFNKPKESPRGPPNASTRDANTSMVVTSLTVSQLSVPDLWRLDTIGIRDPIEQKTQEEEEAEVLRRFEETVRRGPDGRYIVRLPWRCNVPDLPTNRVIAEKRLLSTTKRLKANSTESLLGTVPEKVPLPTQGAEKEVPEVKNMFEVYDQVFREWLAEGIIEEISDDDSTSCHYLPHRAVIKEDSATTKVRPVFDASCKSGRAPSLNDCLEKGPNLIDLIPSVMLRFREGSIGVISDIRKAFLMIEVAEEDRDFLRFLWWEGPACDKKKVFRHKRVVFGVNCSPFLLGAVIRHHLALYGGDWKPVAEKLIRSLYVDNNVASINSTEALEEFQEKCIQMLAEAGMDLRLWQNSLNWDAPGTPPEDERVVPVLGMKWDRKEDVLYCDVPSSVVDPNNVTKRQILSVTQQIFDPLGILAPVTVQPKMLLQEMWKQKTGWDEVVGEDVRKRFLRWTSELPLVCEVKVPRCFRDIYEDRSTWSLHCFTDASSYAYAAVVFLRCGKGPTSVQLLEARSRLAPIKKGTIPRLELVGCQSGARLTAAVVAALDMEDVPCYYWSDSSTALSWIRRNDDWGTFVGNRVRDILKLSKASQWNHVPGKENPADLPSRGCTASELIRSRWWEGPDWLREDSSAWPQEEVIVNEEAVIAERKKSVNSGVAVAKPKVSPETTPWYMDGCESYTEVIRRACHHYRSEDHVASSSSGEISEAEFCAAEKKIIRLVQEEAFPNKEPFKRLNVFEDSEGILRVKTKLLMREDKPDFKTPMLLPSSHPLVMCLVNELHVSNSHAQVQTLISIVREKFWIVHTRRAIKAVINSCQRCRIFNSKNVEVDAAALPEDRVRDAEPFEITGVDLAGPLFLGDKKKAWIVLFTCAVYRAVHLELVTSLDTEHFLQAFRRFIARRGRPTTVYSDNGTNFRGAVNALKTVDWDKVRQSFGVHPIQWKFSPPSAPWWGGFWERMVRSVKDLLVRVLGRSSVLYEELVTILCDVESVVNQRPLTVMTEDDDDLVALTPAMFLQGVRESGVPGMDELDMKGMGGRFRYRQDIMRQLRSRFRTEYLGILLQQPSVKSPVQLKVGDRVLIGEDNKKRILWEVGEVEGFIGKRIAKVRTSNGTLMRAVKRLFPLELHPADEDSQDKVEAFTRCGRRVRKPQRFQ